MKLNIAYGALGIVDLHYENLSWDRLSFGASLNVNLRWNEYLGSMVLFGRAYTSNKVDKLFFELHHATHLDGSCNENQIINYFGPGIGYKLLLKKDFSIEVLAGVGFSYLDVNCKELGNVYYPRFGLLIGKRF